jgi:sugar-specific transcriptional regulator TrmB
MASEEHLERLGLGKNEAKALSALSALGPSGASDVHKQAGIPRNKAYEALESLGQKGLVEVQNGYPILYRPASAKAIVDTLTENYGKEAREALMSLEKQEEMAEPEDRRSPIASAWMVRGELGIKRRLAEIVADAETDVFGITSYPPKYFLSAKTTLKAAAKRGVNVRMVCMIRPTDDVGVISRENSAIIEFRAPKALQTMKVKLQPFDDKLVGGFAGIPGYGGMVIIDELLAYDIVDDGKDPKRAAGIVFKAPGIPNLQKATVERILALYTRKL